MQGFEKKNANLFVILFIKDLLFAQKCDCIFEGEAIEPHRIVAGGKYEE